MTITEISTSGALVITFFVILTRPLALEDKIVFKASKNESVILPQESAIALGKELFIFCKVVSKDVIYGSIVLE